MSASTWSGPRSASTATTGAHHRTNPGMLAIARCRQRPGAARTAVGEAQCEHHERAREHEENAGGEATAYAVQQPAGVGGELLRLRAWQQHAEVERGEKAALLDPFLLVHQDAVHDRDLSRGTAEADV